MPNWPCQCILHSQTTTPDQRKLTLFSDSAPYNYPKTVLTFPAPKYVLTSVKSDDFFKVIHCDCNNITKKIKLFKKNELLFQLMSHS
jgi:hypothetical protein